MESALFLRLAVSRDKEGILALAQNGVEIQRPEDVIKSTYTLEFLNLPELPNRKELERLVNSILREQSE